MKSTDKKRSGKLLIAIPLLFLMISCICSSLVPNENVSPAQLTVIADKVQQTQTAAAARAETEKAASQPSPQPTYTFAPTYTSEPSPTATTAAAPDTPVVTPNTPEGQFTMQVEKSTNEFYCKYDPKTVTFTLRVSNINLGFAIYYHFEDLKSGAKSPNLKADIHRDASESFRFINLNGDPALGTDYHSIIVTLPAGMGPSKLVYQLIADDNSYRSAKMEDVTFYPCSYTKP